MLTLVLGRAGTGKTSYAMEQFRSAMEEGGTKLYFIVPEQYSHDAERQLLLTCGDRLSLFGEVLSFSRLCSRVFAELGGIGAKLLDDGGRLLVMSRAVWGVANKLKVYGKSEQTPDFLTRLMSAAKEFKSACVAPSDLDRAAHEAENPLKEKLSDLSLILGAYDAFFGRDTADPDDRLDRLARVIADSELFDGGHIFLDGFTDFTAQELRVVEALLKKDAGMTVCLTCDGLDAREEIFEPSRKTALKLLRMAQESGVETKIVRLSEKRGRAGALDFLEQNLFLYHSDEFQGDTGPIEVFKAASPDRECEVVASKVLELMRRGYRLRDIGVAVCDWETYGSLAENIFEKYGIPVFVSKKTDISLKPPAALIEKALEIVAGGWEYETVFAYLKTGLAGVSAEDIDALENYVLTWNLRGSIWTRDEDWTFPPAGYEPDHSGNDEARLQRVNGTRRAVMLPLRRLQKALKASVSYGDKLRSVYGFMEDIGLYTRIADKSAMLLEQGELQLSGEYEQLWDVLIRALDQFSEIAGSLSGSMAEFTRLWKLLISQYDIGSIPVALDRVSLGDMTRIRRRGNKCLIVIGASDDALPVSKGGDGLLSDGERRDLIELGVSLSGTAEERLYREMNLIYSALTIPSDRLIVTYPKTGAGGGEKRPSFVVRRLITMFSLAEETDEASSFRLSSAGPAFELAASYINDPENPSAAAAAEYFGGNPARRDKLAAIADAARLSRGNLSDRQASALYGRALTMSASRIDKFYACRFLYFMQYGLNAKPRKPAGFDAPTAGTFMHYILENVTRDIRDGAGFEAVSDDDCAALVKKYVDKYAAEKLDNFKDKTSRFRYLFNRLVKDASFIVLDMVRELKNSDFRPLDFELEFSDTGALPPHVVRGDGGEVKIKGFVDRVDGWEHDGKLYLRVVDYKTGKKTFHLSDVLYGMNMQMLIYLFALNKSGAERYKKEVVSAGVLYAPAREELVSASRYDGDDEIDAARLKKLRRSGMLLWDDTVLEAMEHGDDKKFLPVKMTKDGPAGDSLAGLSQLGKLSAHIDKMLLEIAGGVRTGSISAEPYFKNDSDNACQFCDFAEACHFDETNGDRRRFLRKLKTDEAWEKITGEAEL